MRFRLLSVELIAAVILSCAPHASAQTSLGDGYTFHVAPHSHIDGVWYWTYDQTVVLATNILSHALEMLHRDPRFTFTQDQMIAIEPFWKSLPAAEKEFLRRMVREKRFELATGMYLQPDETASDFESLVRQYYPALAWMESTFSTKVSTAWLIDTYGHTPQMPQLFRKAGLNGFIFMRDVPAAIEASVTSPFYWEGADGTKILSYWLSGTYGLRGAMRDNIRRYVDHRSPGVTDIFLPYGGDVYVPDETTAQIETKIRDAAAKAGIPVKKVVFSTPAQYLDLIRRSGISLPAFHHDFNPPLLNQDLRGLFAQRPKTKVANRRAEYMLESAEKLSSIAAQFGHEYPAEKLRAGWLNVLFNQDHDALPGSHTDSVDEEMMSRYGGAIEAGRSALSEAMYRISRNVNTSGAKRYPFLVFNPLSFARTEVVKYQPLFKEQLKNFRLLDDAGDAVPFRTEFVGRRRANEPLSMAAIEFVARDVPAMGYRLYQFEPLDGSLELATPAEPAEQVSNRFFTLRIDTKMGGIRSIANRATGEELLDTSKYQGNELVLAEENNPDMEGTLRFNGREVRMLQFPIDSITQTHDEIGIRIQLAGPFLSGRRQQEIYLYNDLPRIDFKTELLGFPGHDGMLTAVFPLRGGEPIAWNYETHNAVTARPDGIYAGQTFVDAQRTRGGVAFLNRGLGGVQAEGNLVRLMLLRSLTSFRGYHSPAAAEAGTHTFEYSLFAHSDDWRNGVVEQAHSFTSPLLTIATDPHPGALPPRHGFVSVEQGHFEITALKRSEDTKSWILRGHEAHGMRGKIRIALDRATTQVWLSDLRENRARTLPNAGGKVEFDCNPFEFITLRLEDQPER